MKKAFYFITLLHVVVVIQLNAQVANLPEGSKAAQTNISANQCPCILNDLRVVFKVTAPEAGKVQIDLGKVYDMKKDEKGVWTVTTDQQVPGWNRQDVECYRYP